MGPRKWIVEFYKRANGRCPTADFLDSLSNKEKVFIRRSLQRLEEYGTELGRLYVAPLREHIWELRKETHQGNIRLLYFFFDGYKFIITHGFKKKSDKVPESEIDRAIEYQKDYLERIKRLS
ncbi:MAG: type II toxin-antitoxin system RelE/ParE family toxin [Chloroflexi bacterium]|nr:type II toxin-antitoxin system RelE/ParE family toxin [Chloroflexota bacterium]